MAEKFTVLRTTSKMGKSTMTVRCTCGEELKAFTWSWAVHGFKRCSGCKSRLMYLTHEVIPDDLNRHYRGRGRGKGK